MGSCLSIMTLDHQFLGAGSLLTLFSIVYSASGTPSGAQYTLEEWMSVCVCVCVCVCMLISQKSYSNDFFPPLHVTTLDITRWVFFLWGKLITLLELQICTGAVHPGKPGCMVISMFSTREMTLPQQQQESGTHTPVCVCLHMHECWTELLIFPHSV